MAAGSAGDAAQVPPRASMAVLGEFSSELGWRQVSSDGGCHCGLAQWVGRSVVVRADVWLE
eukprot:3037143-Alexandrium_andersonii.AAC.1